MLRLFPEAGVMFRAFEDVRVLPERLRVPAMLFVVPFTVRLPDEVMSPEVFTLKILVLL